MQDKPVTPRQFRPRVSFTDEPAGRHHATPDSTRSARHRAGAYGSYSASRTVTGGTRGTRPRRSRHAQTPSRSTRDRATSGAHRAPGTLPIEAWLDAAKSRPQVLLGTLVAAGLLLTAVPIQQSGGENISVMNAAAQAVTARFSSTATEQKQQKPEKRAEAAPPAESRPEPAESPEAKPQPEATRTEEAGRNDPSEQLRVPQGDGPFNSLKTTGTLVVALTFDDGPDPEQTPKILDLLDKYQVKAVFCLVGTQAQAHPDLVRRIADSGHVLCNHTWNHDLAIGKKKADRIQADLDRTDAAIRAAVPDAAIPYFRAPGGNFTDRLVKTAYAGGMTSLYWEVDPRDWEHPENETPEQHVKRIIADVKRDTRPGSIVLSHDFNQPTTITAYEKLLPWLVENFQLGLPGESAAPEQGTPVPAEPAPDPSATPVTPPSGAPVDGANEAPKPGGKPTATPAAGV